MNKNKNHSPKYNLILPTVQTGGQRINMEHQKEQLEDKYSYYLECYYSFTYSADGTMTHTSPNSGVFWSGTSNMSQSQKEEPSWGTQEEFLPEQGNGSVSLPPIVSNTWQQVSLQIQHKTTFQKQLKRCFRCPARGGADNWRNFHCFYG